MSKVITTTLEQIIAKEKGSLISGPFGSNISSKYFVCQGIPVIRGNNLTTSQEKFIDSGFVFITKEKADELNCYAMRNDLIFTAAGTLGQVGIIPLTTKYQLYTISNKQIRARLDKEKVNALFAYYWFSSPWIRKRLTNSNKGTTVPLLTLSEIKDLPIKYPVDLEEQYKIAHAIDIIDQKIDLNYRIIAELEAMAKTIYDYWFVQFDFPDAEGKPYRQSGGEMEYNEILKKEIPKGWKLTKIRELANVISGFPFDSNDYTAKGIYKLITIKNVQDDGVNLDGDNHISVLPQNIPDYCILRPQDILMSLTGNVGRVGLMFSENCLLNQRVALIQPKKKKLIGGIYFLFKSNYMRNKMESIAIGTSQKNLSPIDTENLLIPLEKDIFEEYSNIVNEFATKLTILLKENLELTRLRDWLLPMLMNGQATVE